MTTPRQLIVLLFGACGIVSAQTTSRADLIESARAQKEAHLTDETAPKAEVLIQSIEHSVPYRLLTGELDGFGLGFGTIIPGSGFRFRDQAQIHAVRSMPDE